MRRVEIECYSNVEYEWLDISDESLHFLFIYYHFYKEIKSIIMQLQRLNESDGN
jgi:hypothetical protein